MGARMIHEFLRRVVLQGLACTLLTSMALSQQAPSASSLPLESAPIATSDGVALPASMLIALLKQQPELTVEVKRTAAAFLQTKGIDVSEDSISDEMLYDRINSDPELRKALTSWLWTRGY